MKSANSPEQPQPQLGLAVREFAMRFTSTPRGARLARRLVSHRLHDWGHPYASPVNDAVTLVTAELTANAVRHGHVPGRDFHLGLTLDHAENTIRVEVTDTRTEKLPARATPSPDADSGRGLLLVATLAHAWGAHPRRPGPGKTVWAEFPLVDGGRVSRPVSPSARNTNPATFTR